MATGKVKWFNNAKGYGFILPESGGEDLFAHYSSIEMDGYKTLRAGQDVEFEIQEGPKGLHAVNIRSLEEAAETPAADSDPVDAEASAEDDPSVGADSSEEAHSSEEADGADRLAKSP